MLSTDAQEDGPAAITSKHLLASAGMPDCLDTVGN